MELRVVFVLAAMVAGAHGLVYPRSYINITDEEALDRAKQILSQYPLVDGHNDLPHQFRMRIQNQLDLIDLQGNTSAQWGLSHTDIPRFREGQVGAQIWSCYVRCSKNDKDAVRGILEQFDLIHRMTSSYPDDFQYVTSADELEAAFAAGKIGSLIGIEGGHGLDSSLGALRMMYALGVRYLGLTHNCNTDWGEECNEDDVPVPPNKGLTEFGLKFVQELNRLGIMIDLAHVSKATMIDAIQESQAPVIFSHSNAWALCNHVRNVQDDVMQMVAATGGIIMVTFVKTFVSCPPSNPVTDGIYIPQLADHIEYIRDFIGVDHVGAGGDFDGTASILDDLYDVSRYPYLVAELVKRGWSDLDIEKFAGRNLVRVLRAVEQVRDSQAGVLRPLDDWVPPEDIVDPNGCRTTE